MSPSDAFEAEPSRQSRGSALVGSLLLLVDRDAERAARQAELLRAHDAESIEVQADLGEYESARRSGERDFNVWDAVVWHCDARTDAEELTRTLVAWYELFPAVPVVVVANEPDMTVAMAALRGRAADLVGRSVGDDGLLAVLERVLRQRPDPIDAISPSNKRALVVGAHPDDAEIGVGGTIHRLVRRGWDATVLTMSHGSGGGDPAERTAEAQRAAHVLGAVLVMEDFPDGAIDDSSATVRAIERVVRRVQPEIVLVHTDKDTHQDHRAVHRATLVAARSVPRVGCYQSPSAMVTFQPNRFVDLRERDLEAKLAAIRAHGSQARTRAYLDEDLVRATARYWGRYANAHFTEPLEMIRASTPTRFRPDGH
ncbi:PIG-L deacetylase family protein [Streptomyces sp. NPDC059639]|uniref:PIG-L deacetylase family protein n=1 Tax=Streptomyces sp. NPDC059639 TaxID=3346891 RepID=UPI0036849332